MLRQAVTAFVMGCAIVATVSGCALFGESEPLIAADAGGVDAGDIADAATVDTGDAEPPTTDAGSDAASEDAAGSGDAGDMDGGTDAGSPAAELVLYLDCESFQGDNLMPDKSGRRNNAICPDLDCPDLTRGPFGDACEFDGVNEFLRVPWSEEFNIDDGFTIAAWIFPVDVGSAVSLPYAPGIRNTWQIYFSFNTVLGMSFVMNSVDSETATPNTTVVEEEWIHVAMSWDSETQVRRTYVDGVPFQEGVIPADISRDDIWIGIDRNNGDFALPFDGMVDEFRVYRGVLDDAAILELGTR